MHKLWIRTSLFSKPQGHKGDPIFDYQTLESASLVEVWAESRSIVELQQRTKCELGHSSRMLRLRHQASGVST